MTVVTVAGTAMPVVSVAAYDGAMRRVVLAWKRQSTRSLTPVLARALAAALVPVVGGCSAMVVPVPPRSASIRRRGEDIVGRLARGVVEELNRSGGEAAVSPILEWVGDPGEQIGRDGRERRQALDRLMRARAPIGGRIVILDDVITTGATVGEAVRALREASGRPAAHVQRATGAVLAASLAVRIADRRPVSVGALPPDDTHGTAD